MGAHKLLSQKNIRLREHQSLPKIAVRFHRCCCRGYLSNLSCWYSRAFSASFLLGHFFKCQSETFNFHPLTLKQFANGFCIVIMLISALELKIHFWGLKVSGTQSWPWTLDPSQFSWSELGSWYFKYPKYAISGSRVKVYIFGKIDVETLNGQF